MYSCLMGICVSLAKTKIEFLFLAQLSNKFGSEDWLIRVIFVEIGVIFLLAASIVLYWKIYGPSINRLLSGKD